MKILIGGIKIMNSEQIIKEIDRFKLTTQVLDKFLVENLLLDRISSKDYDFFMMKTNKFGIDLFVHGSVDKIDNTKITFYYFTLSIIVFIEYLETHKINIDEYELPAAEQRNYRLINKIENFYNDGYILDSIKQEHFNLYGSPIVF
jgi:hypothetical protein